MHVVVLTKHEVTLSFLTKTKKKLRSGNIT
jgi:hypothetical protein